jgi:hypothetical protein
MTRLEQAKWMAMGYKAKIAVRKLDARYSDWEIFKRTLGFYQWNKKNKATPAQLALFEEGFKHEKECNVATVTSVKS